MNNIIIVKLDSTYAAVYSGIWQWNYGQILRIQGGNLPKVVEVHFSLQDKGGDSITRIGTTVDGATDVPIPDSFLEKGGRAQDYKIYAFIYLEDGTAGNTEYKIEMTVKSRPKPEVPGTPEEPELFRETVKAVNVAADRAETAEQNARSSETEAGKYAASASESAVAAEKNKEDALREVGEKKREAIEAIQEQEETSVGKIINHTDNEIQRILNQTAESKGELEQTITNADDSKGELDHSIETAGTSKTALDKSTELAGTAKTELDTSIREAGTAKIALDESTETAGTAQETLNATVKQAGALDTSLGEKIETGTQLKTDLVASGEKAVQDIQNAGSEQLGKMQAVSEEFTANREQINVNKEDISILKEEMSKNYLDDAKTKRSLDALWKLNQGISYQFETDAEKAYQKDIPSGAKLVSVKKIGGRTIVWNQLANVAMKNNVYLNDRNRAEIKIDSDKNTITATLLSEPTNNYHTYITYIVRRFEKGHKYLFSAFFKSNKDCVMRFDKFGSSKMTTQNLKSNIERLCADILIYNEDDANNNISIYPTEKDSGFSVGDWYSMRDFKLFDLTKMFGAGNEPSTPGEFEALFPEDYYPYNEGELMSMPVNEVVEKGRNLFDCYGFSCSNIYDENAKRDITNNYGTTISTINPTNSITVTQDKVDNSAVISSYANGYFCVGVRMKNNKEYVMSFDFIPTKMLIDNPIMKLLINGDGSNSSGAIDGFSLNVKKHIVVKFTYKSFESRQYIEFRNGGMSGIFENFQLEDGATATAYSPYHKNTYPIPQAILDLDGYGDGVSDDVYNYVDWENKEYHKRVGKYIIDGSENIVKEKSYWVMTVTDFEKPRPSTLNAICTNFKTSKSFFDKWGNIIFRLSSNGFVFTDSESKFANANEVKNYFQQNNENIYYELNEEQIIDISDIIDNTFQEPIEVEAGGTLTFHNSNGDSYRLPIPNEEEYIVSLAEVGGGGASE